MSSMGAIDNDFGISFIEIYASLMAAIKNNKRACTKKVNTHIKNSLELYWLSFQWSRNERNV